MNASHSLSVQRKSTHPIANDTWQSIASRELLDTPVDQAVELLQSWNLHVFMRPSAPTGSTRGDNPILPSDIIFLEAPIA